MRITQRAARQVAALLVGLVLGSALVAYGVTERSLAGIPAAARFDASPNQPEPNQPEPEPEPAWIDQTLGRMSLEDKVGQLFISIAYGEQSDAPDQRNRTEFGVDTAADLVGRYRLGGVIFFNWTSGLTSPQQVATLSNGLQQAALRSGAGVPLLVSTDQENGAIIRIGPPATALPTTGALGMAGSVEDAKIAAEISGRELRAMGVNQDLAPVADVNFNPDNRVLRQRTFSADPSVAAAMTAAQVTGYQRSVAATAKHFPGHGATATDSHVALPVVDHDRAQWERLDAPPFRAAMSAGVDVIMIGHIAMPGLDPSGQPATLSPMIVDGLLRRDLGYCGVVMTDSLRMQGVREVAADVRIPVLALAAGADLLLMPANLDLAYRSVLAALHTGELTEARIDASVRRILRLKWRRGLVDNPLVDIGQLSTVVGSAQSRDLVSRLAASHPSAPP